MYFDLYTRSIIPAERLLQGRCNNRIVYYQIYLSKDTTYNSIGQAEEGVLNGVRQRQSILQRQLVDFLTIVARGYRGSSYYRLVLIIDGTYNRATPIKIGIASIIRSVIESKDHFKNYKSLFSNILNESRGEEAEY